MRSHRAKERERERERGPNWGRKFRGGSRSGSETTRLARISRWKVKRVSWSVSSVTTPWARLSLWSPDFCQSITSALDSFTLCFLPSSPFSLSLSLILSFSLVLSVSLVTVHRSNFPLPVSRGSLEIRPNDTERTRDETDPWVESTVGAEKNCPDVLLRGWFVWSVMPSRFPLPSDSRRSSLFPCAAAASLVSSPLASACSS